MVNAEMMYSTTSAAGAELDRRAKKFAEEHKVDYRAAVYTELAADTTLAEAYAAIVPAVPVTDSNEREILDWILRALKDDMAGMLPGALGLLALEADKFKKLGMPIEESARRAMGLPHLMSAAKLLLEDIRRNAPENKPVPASEANRLAQGKTPGDTVHLRVTAITRDHSDLSYAEAMTRVFQADPALKTTYAGVQS